MAKDMTPEHDYWMRVVEKDAAWDAYCKNPTDELYIEYLRAFDDLGAWLAADVLDENEVANG